MNVTKESLTKKHGDKAERIFEEIADLGGYGKVDPNYVGGLDVFSALDPSHTDIPEHVKAKIANLAGVDRKDVDVKIQGLVDDDGNLLPGQVRPKDQTVDAAETQLPPKLRNSK